MTERGGFITIAFCLLKEIISRAASARQNKFVSLAGIGMSGSLSKSISLSVTDSIRSPSGLAVVGPTEKEAMLVDAILVVVRITIRGPSMNDC